MEYEKKLVEDIESSRGKWAKDLGTVEKLGQKKTRVSLITTLKPWEVIKSADWTEWCLFCICIKVLQFEYNYGNIGQEKYLHIYL